MNIRSCSTRKACPTARQHIKCPICEEAMQNRIPCGLRRRRKPQKPKGMGNVWCRQYPYTPIQTEAKETHSAKGVYETATCRFHSRQCTSLYSPPATYHLPPTCAHHQPTLSHPNTIVISISMSMSIPPSMMAI